MSSSKNHWIDIADMLQLQRQLLAEHQEWPPHTPENSSYHLLGAVEELGEVAAILRKVGVDAIMTDGSVRREYVGELTDIFAFLINNMLCLGITAEELASAFWRKHHTNLWRDYNAERTAWISAVHGEKEQSDDNPA